MLRFLTATVASLVCSGALAVSLSYPIPGAESDNGLLPVGEHSLICVSGNNPESCAQGLAGFGVSFSVNADQYTWTLRNHSAPAAATRIYLELTEDAQLLELDAADSIFGPGKKLKSLPGGSGVDFDTRWYFEAASPSVKNGLLPGEQFSVTFVLPAGEASTLEILGRLGFHAQGFDGGYSESFVTSGAALTPVPLPGSNALFGAGAFGLGLTAVRRRRNIASSGDI